MTSETLIDFIRHGEPVGGSRYRGHTIDDPLSEKGWRQMWDAVGDCRNWQRIVTSPMTRCSEFASALSERLQIPCSTDAQIREIGFGEWEGQTRQQLQQKNLEQYLSFYRDPVNCRPPGAEDLGEFIKRTTQAYEEIVNRYVGERILCITHAGVIRAIIAHTLHSSPLGLYKIKIDNAGITRIRFSENSGVLEFVNRSFAVDNADID